MDQKTSFSYPLRFAMLLLLTGVFMVVAALVLMVVGPMLLKGPLLTAMNQPENANISRLLNTIASGISFFLPPFFLAMITDKRPFRQLGFNSRMAAQQVFLVVVITFASMVVGGALGELNETIPIPADWYAYFKRSEDTYRKAMMAMATMRTPLEYFYTLLAVAAAPAIFEEVLFRGSLQQLLVGWSRNKWIGILIASFLFSAVHFSYFGFLPRMALGIVLGLVFYYSKNIWLNILLHFLNNAIIVTQLYVVSRQGKSIEKTLDESMPVWWGLIGLIILFVLIKAFRRKSSQVIGASSNELLPENIPV